MKKISMMFAALAMAVPGTLAISAPASAQVPTYACQADSLYARGVWVTTDLDYACRRALVECAARTPYGAVCTVTRWWVAY